jgi:hypothetical protein
MCLSKRRAFSRNSFLTDTRTTNPVNNPSRTAWASTFFLVVALFYAPLAYGCTRPEMLPPLYALLAAGFVTGMISFILDGKLADLPKPALICAMVVLVQGWWLTAQPVFPSVVAEGGDSLVDVTMENIQRLSLNSMLLTTAGLAAFVVLCGLLTQPFLRRFILLAAATSGVLICLIGDTLKLTGEPLMRYFWNPLDIYWNDFAFYRYQGNAGAFINLTWPLILVFTRRAYTPTNRLSRKIFWSIAMLAAGSALFLNASKSALVIGLVILPWPFLTRLLRMRPRNQIILGVFTAVVVAVALYASSHMIGSAFARLTNTSEVSRSAGGRVGAYKQFVSAVPQVGFFGLGPGLFQLAFPYQISPLGNTSVGLREYAHEDYLQTVLEWGWFGAFWWTLFVFGGLYRALKTHAKKEQFASKTERHLLLAAILGVMGALVEAAIDFPLQIASIRLFFMVLLALCWVSPFLLNRPRRTSVSMRRYRLPIPAELAGKPVANSL